MCSRWPESHTLEMAREGVRVDERKTRQLGTLVDLPTCRTAALATMAVPAGKGVLQHCRGAASHASPCDSLMRKP